MATKDNSNGNTFKIMFWVMSGVCITGLLFLGSNVIANDNKYEKVHINIRKEISEGDEKIESKVECKVDKLEEKISDLTKMVYDQNGILKSIKEKMDRL